MDPSLHSQLSMVRDEGEFEGKVTSTVYRESHTLSSTSRAPNAAQCTVSEPVEVVECSRLRVKIDSYVHECNMVS